MGPLAPVRLPLPELPSEEYSLVLVSRNAGVATALTLESFRYYHPECRAPLLVLDNGSTDGVLDYLRPRAQVLIESDNSLEHGHALDELFRRVETPYVLSLDPDVEFHRPVLPRYLQNMRDLPIIGVVPDNRFGLGTTYIEWLEPNGKVKHRTLAGQDKIDTCCSLWRTPELQGLLQWTSFGTFINASRGKWFDTGAMLWHVANAAGYIIERVRYPWEEGLFTHYGGMSSMDAEYYPYGTEAPVHVGSRPDHTQAALVDRYASLQPRLALLRAQIGALECR